MNISITSGTFPRLLVLAIFGTVTAGFPVSAQPLPPQL
jgi:hypothetical protein